MEKNEDLLISDQSFIDFLLHEDSRNMTNFSWNASTMPNFSPICINLISYSHIDIKTFSSESMMMLLNNLYQVDKERHQEYKGPTGINTTLLETYTIKANKLLKFLHSKKHINPNTFFQYYKIIEEFLSYCSLPLNKSPSNIQDLDLYDEKLFFRFVSEKKLPNNKIIQFERIYRIYFSKKKFGVPLNTNKKIEKFNHVVIERHLDEVRKECTKESVNKRKYNYKDFLNWLTTVYVEFQSYTLNSIPLYLVTTDNLEEYKSFLLRQFKEGIYKKHTISDVFYNVRSLFSYLYQMKIIPNDITRDVNYIKFEKYKYRDLPTKQHLSEFFDAVMCYTPNPLKFCTAYKLMLYLGLRKSEAANLESSNINFGTNTISVKGKDGKYDILPLPKLLLDDLYSLVNLNEKYIFGDNPQIIIF